MAFSQASISDVRVFRDDAELYIVWSSSAPRGTAFQVYLDRRLAWFGTSTSCNAPIPADASGRNAWVEVGAVGPDETHRDFSPALSGPGGSGNRAELTWAGGTYLDPTGRDSIQGYHIYQSGIVGGGVDYSHAVDTVSAYPGGLISDGFGVGGFGQGGFGRSANSYEWQSGPLASGNWQFAVVPYNKGGGAQAAPLTVGVTIVTAPRPPAMGDGGARLTYAYAGQGSRQATLNWLASPE